MKRVKLIFVIGIIVGLVFIGLGAQGSKYISVDKKNVSEGEYEKNGLVMMGLSFYKYDQNKNFLAGTKFKLSSYNNVYKLYPSEDYYDNDVMITGHREYYGRDVFENAYGMLSEKQKTAVSSVTQTSDFLKFDNGENVICAPYSVLDYMGIGGLTKRMDGYFCAIPLPTVFYLEETKAPADYAKTKVLVPGVIFAEYYIEGYDAPIEMTKRVEETNYRIDSNLVDGNYDVELVNIAAMNMNAYIDYGDIDESVLLGTDFSAAYDAIYENAQGTECQPNYDNIMVASIPSMKVSGAGMSKMFAGVNYCYFSLFNEKGTVNIEVSTTVNDKNSVTTTTNNTLKYKVLVKNTGTVDAIDNQIISKLPEGFKYVEGSASNGGVYNANDNTITWSVPKLRVANDMVLSYDAYAPEGVSSLKSYIGEAYAQAFGMNNRIESNKTTVNLMLNPKTSAPIYGILITLLIAWGVAGYLFLYKKYFMKKKKINRKRKAAA